jgi:hypothetical protein
MNKNAHPMYGIVRNERAAALKAGVTTIPVHNDTGSLHLSPDCCRAAVKLTLIMLRDASGSVLFLPPMQIISENAVLIPAVLATKAELTALKEAAARLACRFNHIGSLVFRFALCRENSEFIMLEATAALTLENLLSAYAMRYALSGVTLQLELGQTLAKAVNTYTGLSAALIPRIDYFALCNESRICYASNLPAAVFSLWGEEALTMETANSDIDGALKYAVETLRETGERLSEPGGCAALISRARGVGFSKKQIESLTGCKMKLEKSGFLCADAGFGEAVTYYMTSGGRGAAHRTDKPRLLLLNSSAGNEPAVIAKTEEAQGKGYDVVLLSPEITAAPVRRHYAAQVTEESKAAAERAEKPDWVEEIAQGRPVPDARRVPR